MHIKRFTPLKCWRRLRLSCTGKFCRSTQLRHVLHLHTTEANELINQSRFSKPGFFAVLKQALHASSALSADSPPTAGAVSPQENGSSAPHSIPLMDEECSDTDASTDKVSCQQYLHSTELSNATE